MPAISNGRNLKSYSQTDEWQKRREELATELAAKQRAAEAAAYSAPKTPAILNDAAAAQRRRDEAAYLDRLTRAQQYAREAALEEYQTNLPEVRERNREIWKESPRRLAEAQRAAQREAYTDPAYRAYNRELWKDTQRPQATIEKANRDIAAAQRQRDRLESGASYRGNQFRQQEQAQQGSYLDRMAALAGNVEGGQRPDLEAASQYARNLYKYNDQREILDDKEYQARNNLIDATKAQARLDYAMQNAATGDARQLATTYMDSRKSFFGGASRGNQIARSVAERVMYGQYWKPGNLDEDAEESWYEPIQHMTDKEAATILTMANEGKLDEVQKYYNALEPELNARAYDYMVSDIESAPMYRKIAAGVSGTMSGIPALAQSTQDAILETISGIPSLSDNTRYAILGRTGDRNAQAYARDRLASYARELTMAGKPKLAQDIIEGTYSALDNWMLLPLGPDTALLTMSLNAGGKKATEEVMEGTATRKQTAVLAWGNAGIEYIFENLPTDLLSDLLTGKDVRNLVGWFRHMVGIVPSESIEDGLGNLAEVALDRAVKGRDSKYSRMIREKQAKGLSQKDAIRETEIQLLGRDTVEAMEKAAISSLIMGGVAGASNAIDTHYTDRATGQSITNRENVGGSFEDVVLAEGMKSSDKRIASKAAALDAIRHENRRSEGFKWSKADQRAIGEIYDSLDADAKARIGVESNRRMDAAVAEQNKQEAEQNKAIAAREAELNAEQQQTVADDADAELDAEEAELAAQYERMQQESGETVDMDNPQTAQNTAAEEQQTQRQTEAEEFDRLAAAAEEATRTGDTSVLDRAAQEQQTRRVGNSDEVLGKNAKVPTEEEVRSGNATYGGIPIVFDANQSAEASNYTSEIHVSPKFFALTDEEQRHVLNHEVAHNLSDDLMSQNTGRWNEFASGFITEKNVPQGSAAYEKGQRTYWEGLYGDIGATALSETVTRAVTEYLDDPERLRSRSVQAYNEISNFVNRTAQQPTQEAQRPTAKPITPEQAGQQTANNARKAGLSAEDTLALSNVARQIGVGLDFEDIRDSRIDGYYDRVTGRVVLNKNLSSSDMAWTTFAHEITHRAESAQSYGQLVNVAKSYVTREADPENADRTWRGFVNGTWQEYMSAGIKVDRQGAEFESVARTIEAILGSRESIEAVARYSREDAQALLASINDVLDNTTENGTAVTPESARLVQAQKTLAAALSEVREQQGNNTAETSQPGNAASEVQFSLAKDEQYQQDAEKKNETTHNVSADTMRQAGEDRSKVKERLNSVKEKANLPPDVEGNTAQGNSSYGTSEENTTVCPRSLAIDSLSDAVAEKLGRPLTVEESLFIAQEAFNFTDMPQCLYCYVAMDRMAKREYMGEYLNKRDAVIRNLQNGMSVEEAREAFRNSETDNGKQPKNWTKAREKRFNSWAKNYQSGAPVIQMSDLASDATVASAMKNPKLAAQVKDAMSYAQSASWAKKRVGYTAYNGHILNWKQSRIDMLNSMFGLRMYSFSDFSPAFILENMQMVTDAAVRGLKMLAYTKDLDFVRVFAPTDMNINISTFGMNGPDGTVHEDAMQGASWKEAQDLRAKHPNVGITFVATNDAQVEWALAQDWIDVVIPFHMVKTGAKVAKIMGYLNYTGESSDRTATGKKGEIFPNEHQNDRKKYFAALEKQGLEPRFKRWVDNPYYMKLVNETRRSAGDTPAVQPKFEVGAALQSIDGMVARGGYNVPIGGDLENLADIAEEMAGKIAQGMAENLKIRNGIIIRDGQNIPQSSKQYKTAIDQNLIDAANAGKVQFSISRETEQQYEDAVKRGDMDTAQRMVDKAAKKAGYTLRVYRGDSVPHNVFDTTIGSGTTEYGAGTYFTNAKGLAEDWAIERAAGPAGEDMGYVGQYFLRPGSLFKDDNVDTSAEQWANVVKILRDYGVSDRYIKIASDRGFTGIAFALQSVGMIEEGRYATLDWKNAPKVNDILRRAGYDGVEGEFYDSRQYLIFDPRQAKSADPVTYDDNGNVIPLSERFNPEEQDIRRRVSGFDLEADIRKAVERYGKMRSGEQLVDEEGKPVTRKITMASSYENGKKSRRGYLTAAEANTSVGILNDIQTRAILDQYIPTSDEKNVAAAKELRGNESFEDAYRDWTKMVQGASPWSNKDFAAQVALGQQLYLEALRNGDGEAAINILTDLSEFETRLGQGVQASHLLKRLPPEGQLMRYKRIAETTGQRLKKSNSKAPADVQAVKDAEKVSDKLMKKLAEYRRLKKMQADGETLAETEVRRFKELQVEIDDLTKELEPMRNTLDRLEKRRHEEAMDVGKLKREMKYLAGTDEKSGKLDVLMHDIQEMEDQKNKLNRELIPLRKDLERKIASEKRSREEKNELARQLRSVNNQINKNLQLTIEHERKIAEYERNLGIRRIELQSKLAQEGMTRTKRNELAKQLRHMNTVINNLNKMIAQHQSDIMDYISQMSVKDATVEELKQYEKFVLSSRQIMNTYLRYVKNKGGAVEFPEELAQQYIKAKTEEEREAIREQIDIAIADQLPGTWGEKIRAARYMSMLLNPTTHIRNIFGNVGQFSVSGISDALNAGIEAIAMKGNTALYQAALDKIQKYRQSIEEVRENKTYSEEYRNTQLERLNKGMQEAYKELAKNERRHAVVTPFTDKALYKAAHDDYVKIKDDLQAGGKASETEGIEKRRKIFTSLLGRWVGEPLRNISTNTLEQEDAWFLEGSYTRSFAQYLKANGIDPKTATEDQMNRARSIAFFEAMRNTYRDPSVLANKLNEIEKLNPYLELFFGGVMPYKKTPINVAKRGFEYSPLGLVRSLNDLRLLATHKETNRTKAQMLEDFCHAFTGTALFALGILGQRAGWLFATPGEGDKDRDKKMEEATGRQDYSIRIGNYTYTLDWLAPIVMPLFSGVRAAEVFTQFGNGLETEEDWTKFLDSALEGFVSTLNPMFEMTMLQGITDMMKNYQSEGSGVAASVLWSAIESYALQFFPTVGGKVARVIDPYQRSTKTQGGSAVLGKLDRLRRRAMAKVPGLTYMLPEVVDQYGNAKLNFGGNVATRFLYNMISPGYIKQITHLETDEEIKKLYADLQKIDPDHATKVLAKTVPTSIDMNGSTYYLSPEDYRNYAMRLGKQAYSDLETLMASDEYRNANTVQRSKMVEDVWEAAAEAAKIAYFDDLGIADEYYTKGAQSNIEKLLYDDSQGYREYKNIPAVRDLYESGALDPKTVYDAALTLSHIKKDADKLDALNNMEGLNQDEYSFLYMTKIADDNMMADIQATLDAGGDLYKAVSVASQYYKWDDNAVDEKTGEVGKWVSVDKGTKAGLLADSDLTNSAKEAFYLNKIVSTNNVEKEQAKIADYYDRGLTINDYLHTLGIKYDDEGTAYENAGGLYHELLASGYSDAVKEAAVCNIIKHTENSSDKAEAQIAIYKAAKLTVNDYLAANAAMYGSDGNALKTVREKAIGLRDSDMSDKAKTVAWYTTVSDAKTAEENIRTFLNGGNTVDQFLTAVSATSVDGMKQYQKAAAIMQMGLKSYTAAMKSVVTGSENAAKSINDSLAQGISDKLVATAYTEYLRINADESTYGNAKAQQFAKWLEEDSRMRTLSKNKRDFMRDNFSYYIQIKASAGTYNNLMSYTGMSSKAADSISTALSNLKPLPGAKGVTAVQKYTAIANDRNSNDNEKDIAMYNLLDTDDDEADSKALKYYKLARSHGVSVAQYADFRTKNATLTADKDKKGKSISGSKREKQLKLINSYPISAAAKDDLYRAAGLGESTIKKAPWH